MAFVVTDACVDYKYGDCVDACPADCFYEGEDQLFINPDECTDCNACAPVCPVSACVPDYEAEDEVVERNAEFDFDEETSRRPRGAPVTHGPKHDPSKGTRHLND